MLDNQRLSPYQRISPPSKLYNALGYACLSIIFLVLLLIIWYLASNWSQEYFLKYAPSYLSGLLTTLKLVGLSFIFGYFLAMVLTMMNLSGNRFLKSISKTYDYLIRGTPLLVQTYLIYYGIGYLIAQHSMFFRDIGVWQYLREGFYYAVFAFTLNTAAYQAEIFTSSIENITKSQWEAGHALALPRWIIFLRIILPQAAINFFRPLGNEIIFLLKGSAIVSLISVADIMGVTKRAYGFTYDFQYYIWAAIIYFILVKILVKIIDKANNYLTRHLR